MTIGRSCRQSATQQSTCREWTVRWNKRHGALSALALCFCLTQANAQDGNKTTIQDNSTDDFSLRSFIVPLDPFSRSDPERLSSDQVQELMQPSDDIQNWDAMQASPIITGLPRQSRPVPPLDPLARPPLLTGLQFDDPDFKDQLSDGYKNFNRGLAENLFGKKAGRYFEIDIDKSPEIKFEIRFD